MNNIDNYISKHPSEIQDILTRIRKFIGNEVPDAEEIMVYGVPAFKICGKNLIYAAFKNHIGIYPEPYIIDILKNELSTYETSKGTIKIPLDVDFPFDLLGQIIKLKSKN